MTLPVEISARKSKDTGIISVKVTGIDLSQRNIAE
jgi:hypothetical protein